MRALILERARYSTGWGAFSEWCISLKKKKRKKKGLSIFAGMEAKACTFVQTQGGSNEVSLISGAFPVLFSFPLQCWFLILLFRSAAGLL